MQVLSRRFWSRTTFPLLISFAQLASAQGTGGGLPQKPIFQSLAAHQVFQRDANGLADISLVLATDWKDARIVSAQLIGAAPARFVDGKLVGVPTGGPYHVSGSVEIKGKPDEYFQVGPVFVGDLWVLAGQSNMQGVGDLVNVTPPNPRVSNLGMDGKWGQAVEPLHWLLDSPDPVHSGDTATRAKRAGDEHKTRTKGTGLGLPFAVAMVEATNVPVGLVSCAHGGTSMEQWNPSKKGEGGKSLYGSMLRQVKLAGGKVKGVLWYQGESDAIEGQAVADAYGKTFSRFIAAVRDDFGQADMPFYYVQIGRFVNDRDPRPWNTVQEAQRTLPATVPHTGVVSVIDLPLDDGIHVGTAGLVRTGERLAKRVLRDQFGLIGATTPTLDRVVKGRDNTLIVKFNDVNRISYKTVNFIQVPTSGGGLQPDRHIAGFSIRKADGKEIPLIYEAMSGPQRDTVVLKLNGDVPAGASLWYGWGLDPYCNLVDSLDMAVPVFGPIPLDKIK